MSKIMELADDYAQLSADAECENDEHGTVGAETIAWVDEARAALQAEVERMEAAHQQELAQVKADLKSCQAKNREQLEVNMGLRDSMHRIEQGVDVLIEQRDKLNAEIAALRLANRDLQDWFDNLKHDFDALREDAERYRFWRNRYPETFAPTDITPEEVDRLTDSARSKQ